jgi:hypothetical protein
LKIKLFSVNIKILKYLLVLLVFPFFLGKADAQSILVLKKKVKTVRIFYPGDEVIIKSQKNKLWYNGRIERLLDNEITVTGAAFSIQDISKIKIRRESFNYEANGVMLMAAGALLPPLVLFNSVLEGELSPRPHPWITSAALLTGGLWLISKRNNTISLTRGRHYLRVHSAY